MNSKQKASVAARRIATRHAVIASLEAALEGLPVSVKESGSLRVADELTDSQFDEIARTIATLSSHSTTAFNFAKGDLWNMAVLRYRGGRELIRRLYLDDDVVDRQCAMWNNCGSVARKVPQSDREMSRTWRYYRDEYGRTDSHPTVTDISAVSKRNVQTTVEEYTTLISWEDINGRPYKQEFPSIPIRKAVETFMDKLHPDW